MKKMLVGQVSLFLLLFTALMPSGVWAQDKKAQKLIKEAEEARAKFIESDSLMKDLFDNAAGYVILPNVGKGGAGVGAASGNGILFEDGKPVGQADLKQLNVGMQLGGQAYREVVFFENEEALNRFKEGNFEFSAQASAVAVTAGAAANVNYRDGVMVFTQEKGGLMYEASVGGQKFGYKPFEGLAKQ